MPLPKMPSALDLRLEHCSTNPHCRSARGPNADRRAKLLIGRSLKGSHLGAYSQPQQSREPGDRLELLHRDEMSKTTALGRD